MTPSAAEVAKVEEAMEEEAAEIKELTEEVPPEEPPEVGAVVGTWAAEEATRRCSCFRLRQWKFGCTLISAPSQEHPCATSLLMCTL